MTNEQLNNFVKEQMKLGVSIEAISKMVSAQGWTQVDLNDALSAIRSIPTPQPIPSASTTPTQTIPPTTPPTTNVNIPAPKVISPTPPQQLPPYFSQQIDGQQSSSKFVLKIISVILLILAVIGIGVFAYFKYIIPSILSKDVTPELNTIVEESAITTDTNDINQNENQSITSPSPSSTSN